MLRILGSRLGPSGVARRAMLQACGAGMVGLSLPKVLAAEALSDRIEPVAKSVIFVFLYGGPSQLETFDMKPNAPSTIRGPFKPISSKTPGFQICEHLPLLAQRTDQFAVIRTVNHSQNDHNGTHYIQTGRPLPPAERGSARVAATDKDWPAFGSVISYVDAQRVGYVRPPIPPYVYLPQPLGHYAGYDINGQYAGWLGKRWNPVATNVPKLNAQDNPFFRNCSDKQLDFQPPGLQPQPEVTLDRLSRRASLLQQFQTARRELELSASGRTMALHREQAMQMLCSEEVASAFDVRKEPAKLRDRYGRDLFGQSMLLARRLVEAGSRFITVGWDMAVRGDDTTSWDSHRELTRVNRDHLLPGLDRGLSALLDDLCDRGMLGETLVFVAGEMGRTPRFQNRGSEDGRDHWSYCFPCLFAGAGAQGGAVHGESDSHAAYPSSNPVSPADLAATIYQRLGIRPDLRIPNPVGQPVALVEDGKPISAVFSS